MPNIEFVKTLFIFFHIFPAGENRAPTPAGVETGLNFTFWRILQIFRDICIPMAVFARRWPPMKLRCIPICAMMRMLALSG
jgi:hypothetical protein